MYKETGERIKNPAAFVANIVNYQGGLLTEEGEEIRNPVGYVARLGLRDRPGPPGLAAPVDMPKGDGKAAGKGPRRRGALLYKADGTAIKNPAAFVANIGNYEGDLFTPDWEPIRDPKKYVAALSRQQEEAVAFTAQGTPVRNLKAFVGNMDYYDGGLFTPEGEEIWNPKAFQAGIERKGGAPGLSGKGAGGPTEGAVMFRADGTPVWNPAAFVEKIENYQGGLFTADWQEIRNPKAFVASLQGAAPGGRPNTSNADSPLLFQSDGTRIRNPAAFVSKIAEYSGGLYTSTGEEVWDPKAYVAGVERRRGAPATMGGGAPAVFKANGEKLKNPEAFAANIENYTGGLYTATGEEIVDIHNYLAVRRVPGGGKATSKGGGPIGASSKPRAGKATSKGKMSKVGVAKEQDGEEEDEVEDEEEGT